MIVARLSLLYRNLYETLKTLPCFCYHWNFCTRLLHVNWGLRLYSSWEIRISSLFRACDQPNHSLSLLNLCNTFLERFYLTCQKQVKMLQTLWKVWLCENQPYEIQINILLQHHFLWFNGRYILSCLVLHSSMKTPQYISFFSHQEPLDITYEIIVLM